MRPWTSDRRSRGRARHRRLWLLGPIALLLLVACGQDYPQNSLAPAGPVADKQADLFYLVFWIAVGVFVVVEGLLVYAMVRFRHRPGREEVPVQVHGNARLEVAWTIVPALLLAGVAVPTLGTIFDLARRPPDVGVEINIVGHQWWWEVEYPQQEGISGFVTANEIHIPAGEYVQLNLTADEAVEPGPVIHSFWVPRLGGKQDVIPGRTNVLYLQADEPGTYSGQCAEYCGASHYLMRFLVIAEPRSEFDAWVQDQQQGAAEPAEASEAAEGADVFTQPLPQGPPPGETAAACVACHATDPGAAGTVGPNLAHFGSRQTVAAGILPNDAEGLATWLRNPPEVKPGSRMPDYRLTDDQIDALVAYLQSLE